jgi:hypothetical protein
MFPDARDSIVAREKGAGKMEAHVVDTGIGVRIQACRHEPFEPLERQKKRESKPQKRNDQPAIDFQPESTANHPAACTSSQQSGSAASFVPR